MQVMSFEASEDAGLCAVAGPSVCNWFRARGHIAQLSTGSTQLGSAR
jgi:hypothetical protein